MFAQRRRTGLVVISINPGKLRTLRILLIYVIEQPPATAVLQRNSNEEVKGGEAKAPGFNYSREGHVLYSPLPH